MKTLRFLIVAFFLLGMVAHSEASGWHGGGGHGGGWHGGGGYYHGGYWHGGRGWYGGGFYGPGYFGDPYYYGGYYGDGYYGGGYYPGYYGGYQPASAAGPAGVGAGSVAAPVQEELTRRGYYHGPIDGVVGPGTRAAISSYQKNHDMEINGTINEALLRSLRL